MRYLKKFENKEESTFDVDTYLDYLLSEVREDHIMHKDSTENLMLIIYEISIGEHDRVKRYLNGTRFEDCIALMEYGFGSKTSTVLLVDRFFYSRNQKWLYRNIKWNEHPLYTEFKRWKNTTNKMMSTTFMNAYIADGLPENISLVKGIVDKNTIEFWPQGEKDDPMTFYEDVPTEMLELQFNLFKYLGN
jgi:hypothetical protein